MLAPFLVTACAVRGSVGYRVYDRPHADYHRWDDSEIRYYNRWQAENRERRNYRRLKREDQERYWRWRHDHR